MPSERLHLKDQTWDPVLAALAEDLGEAGDVTCEFFVDRFQSGTARIFAKQAGVAAGLEVADRVFRLIDGETQVKIVRPSGTVLEVGDTVLEATGRVRSLLSAERTALNFIQRLSGIATLTRRYIEAMKPHAARLLDTRKTTPGLRALEKAAVVAGGGRNHRFGLFDMAMVKENHYAANPTPEYLQAAIRRFRGARPGLQVEIEAQTMEQVRDFLELKGVDVIMLDNLTVAQMREAVRMRGNLPVLFEASGGVTLETIQAIAATGVDFVSVGALTHSAPAVDFSLDLVWA
jgi:nicotinate-nucleotide pyrophosphorylase (carboxylating)